MATLLLVGFILYLYVPTLIFKLFADLGIDIGGKRDSTKVEEFFSAAAPSALLNVFAYVVLRSGDRLHIFHFPHLDWAIIASLFDDKLTTLRQHIAGGPAWEIRYFMALMFVSMANGVIYGQVERRLALGQGDRKDLGWRLAFAIRSTWSAFFGDQIVWGSIIALQGTHAFVRLKSDRLFYGQVNQYTKTASGEGDGVVLVRAQRYSREKIADCVAKLKNPLRRLHGSLYIRWSEIADVNFVEPYVIRKIRREVANQLREERKRRKETATAPPGAS